ncbi:MAG TPA: hypothetical protein PL051_00760 [Candidatus Saccharibacteria bacterium]|nr:hypothetical protein [Candidatus Saccharibacteria bacterium]
MRYVRGKALAAYIGVFLLAATLLLPIGTASAAQITNRSLTLQAGAGGDGGSKPSGDVRHLFTFDVATTGNVGSIKFDYCTTASGTCNTPTGADVSGVSFGSESGSDLTGFSIGGTPTTNSFYLTRTAASATSGDTAVLRVDDVTNPSTDNYTFYVRITTYASTDTSGGSTDTGTVAASTATPIVVSGTMPESLVFCTGATVSTTLGVPDCSTATSGNISFNQLFSPSTTATATSQMAASTNANGGYIVTVNGATLTSGLNTITAMNSATTSVPGTGQFGMNLKANATPSVGVEVAPAANGTTLRGQAATNYNTADTFKFTTGDTVANSANGGSGPTNAQIYTISYMVNVPGSQIAGTYTTTLTYVCTATF